MTWTRREFLTASIAGFSIALPHRGAVAGRAVRIGYLIDERFSALRRGVRFGIDEVTRSATLLGWTVVATSISSTRPVDGAGHDLVLMAADVDSSAWAAPTLRLAAWRGQLGANEFAVCPSETTFARARAGLKRDDRTLDRRVVVWHGDLERFGAAQLNDRFRAAGVTPDSDTWIGWFAAKIAWDTAARAQSSEPAALVDRLRDPRTKFDGHKGMALRFNDQRELLQPLYVIEGSRGAADASWKVVGEVRP